MSQPILSVNQVNKRYGNVSALTHVSFALNSGFYALLGLMVQANPAVSIANRLICTR